MTEISVGRRTLVVPLSTDVASLEYNECFCFYSYLHCLPTLDQLKPQTDVARHVDGRKLTEQLTDTSRFYLRTIYGYLWHNLC